MSIFISYIYISSRGFHLIRMKCHPHSDVIRSKGGNESVLECPCGPTSGGDRRGPKSYSIRSERETERIDARDGQSSAKETEDRIQRKQDRGCARGEKSRVRSRGDNRGR